MSNKLLWTLSEDTRDFIAEIEQEVNTIKEDILSGGLLLLKTDAEIVKEYSFNIGKLEGLKVLKQYVENINEQSETVSRETEDKSY